MAEQTRPDFDPPLTLGDRVRIVSAPRSGSELAAWQRRLTGRTGVVTWMCNREDGIVIDVHLDPLTPRQRLRHKVSLSLWRPWGGCDRIERLDHVDAD